MLVFALSPERGIKMNHQGSWVEPAFLAGMIKDQAVRLRRMAENRNDMPPEVNGWLKSLEEIGARLREYSDSCRPAEIDDLQTRLVFPDQPMDGNSFPGWTPVRPVQSHKVVRVMRATSTYFQDIFYSLILPIFLLFRLLDQPFFFCSQLSY